MSKKINKLLIMVFIVLSLGVFAMIAYAADYYSTGETLLNNTVSLSGTIDDLQNVDVNYRVLRSFPSAYNGDFQSTVVDIATTTSSAANVYTDKAVLTWTVPSNGSYLIYTTAEIKRGSTTAARTAVAMSILDSGITLGQTFVADDVDVDNYRTFSSVNIQTLTAGSHTVKIQFARTNATSNICSIKNARIVAMRVDNTQFNIPANGTTTATNYADIATLTFTPKYSEDWLIMAHADVTSSSTTTLSYANLMVGSTQLSESAVKIANTTHTLPFDSYKTIALNGNTSYTFKIQMKNSASATLTYKNVGLYAIPKSIFQASGNAEAIGETSCSTCTSASPTTIATLNLNTGVGGTYLITATGEQQNSSLTVYSGVNLRIGASVVSQSIIDVGATAHYTSFSLHKVVSVSSGTTAVTVQLFTQTSGTAVHARDIRIQAIKLGAASSQKMEVEYSGVGDTLNWSSLNYILNSAFSVASVGTTLQLWNYNSAAYPTSGDGFFSYTSVSPYSFEEAEQTISTNPTYFRNATTGAWKLKISSIKGNGTWIDWSGDLLKYTSTIAIASTAPVIPTLVLPTTGTSGVSLTPTFRTVTTDANDDNLQYEVKICTDSGMSTGCSTFTAANNGWSGADVGTSSYSSGTTATYVVQVGNSLAENTTYYWKTRAIDPAGTNTWSSTQTTAYTFVTNSKPNTPTLIYPANTATGVSVTPTLKTVTLDPNGDSIQYKIELATNSSFTGTTQTFDLSSSSTGWSGVDVGTSAYASGTTAVYIIPVGSSLALSTTYYWRTYAKDPTGTNRWSATQGTVFSFTTADPPIPNLTQASFRWSADDASGEVRSAGGVGDSWYDPNYSYRQPISVVNQVDSSLTTYQIGFTLDTSTEIGNGKMQNTCADIRVSNSDKTSLIDYWIEKGCNTTSTSLWVEIPTLAASAGTTLYVYYGNTAAVAASNGTNTFSYFEDFEFTDTILNHSWTGFSITPLTTYAFTGSYGLPLNRMGSVGVSSALIVNQGPSIYEAEMYPTGTSASRYVEAAGITTPAPADRFVVGVRSSANWNYWTGSWTATSTAISMNNWNNLKFVANGNSNITVFANDTQIYSGNRTDEINQIMFEQYSVLSSGAAYVDALRIRDYASTEPTVAVGTQSTQPAGAASGATWLAAENVGITNVSVGSNTRLRFSVANSGGSGSSNFRLQVAPLGIMANCTSVSSANFTDVPTSAGSSVAVMTTSPNFTNQEATTNQLTDSATTFVAGKMVEYSSNQSDSITLNTDEFTEIEYNLQMTSNVGSTTTYCFRTVNVGTTLNNYTQVAKLTTSVSNQEPSSPYLPYVNNTTAQSGQQSPVYGLIDHTPAFSAVFDDPDTSDTSSNYQLQIGSDSDWATAEIWDSTKSSIGSTCNENARCADIVYGGGTSLVDGSTYYWRIKFWDNSDIGGSWSDTQQFSMNNAPTVSNVVINGNNSIDLSENSSIGISWTSTVTDADNYTNLSSVTGKIYRSGVGSSCTLDNNNCYTDAVCDMSNCSGNSCSALCIADLYFFTEATDTGSTFADQYYQAWVQATDSRTEVGSTISSSTTVDVNTLTGFSIGTSLVYGEVFAGSDTGSSNTVTTITNTGNSLINLEITGDYMCTDYPSCGALTLDPKNQQFNLSTFTYGAGTTLTTSPQVVNIGISKPTQTPSNSYRNLYWGIGIPSSQGLGSYQGATTILVY